MISDDIIKKIKFVFAGDNKDLKKTLDETNKAAASLSKNFDLGKQSNVLDKFIKNLGTTNKQLTATMKGIQTGFKDIAEKDFTKFTKKVEGAYKSLQETQKKIEQAQKSGNSSEIERLEKIKRYQQTNMNSNMSAANNSASAGGASGNTAPKSMLGQLSQLAGASGAAYAAIRSLSVVPNFAQNAGERSINNQGTLGGLGRNNLQRYLSGDIGQELVLGKNKGAAAEEINEAINQGVASRGIRSLGGAFQGMYSAAINGDNPLKGFDRGALETFGTKTSTERQELIDKKMQNSMDPLYMQNLQANAQSRFSIQSSFGANDAQYGGHLRSLQGSRMSESDMQNYMTQNRSILGNNSSEKLLNAPGRLRNTTGMSMDLSNSLLQATQLNGNKDNLSGEDKVKKLFAESFERGIDDSGLLEGILKGTAAIAQSFGSRIDMGRMSGDISSMASAMGGDARATQGATSAMSAYQSMFDGADELGMYKSNFTAQLAGKVKDPKMRAKLYSYLQSKTPEEIQQLSTNEQFQNTLSLSGVDSDTISSINSSSKDFGKNLNNMTQNGRNSEALIQEMMKNNPNMTRNEIEAKVGAVLGSSLTSMQGTDEAKAAMYMKFNNSVDQTQKNTYNPKGLSPMLDNTQSGTITNMVDRSTLFSQDAMNNVDASRIEAAKVSGEQTMKATGGTMGLGGSVTNLISALSQFANALTTDQGATKSPYVKGGGN